MKALLHLLAELVDLATHGFLILYLLFLWLSVTCCSPIIGPLRHPRRSSVMLMLAGLVLAFVHDLLADYLIAVSLMFSHLLIGYSLHLGNRSPSRLMYHLMLFGIVGLMVVSSIVALAAGMQLLWCVCALVTVVHLLLSTQVSHE